MSANLFTSARYIVYAYVQLKNKNSEMEAIADIYYCFIVGKLYTFHASILIETSKSIMIFTEMNRK